MSSADIRSTGAARGVRQQAIRGLTGIAGSLRAELGPELGLVPVYTGEQVRQAEKPLIQAGRGPALMRSASRGLAHCVLGLLRGRKGRGARVYGAVVTGLIGPGNNGGDGLYALSFLARRGVAVHAVLASPRTHREAMAAFISAGGRVSEGVPAETEVLIDAILGTGFSAQGGRDFVLPAAAGLREALENPACAVVACDIPSGVDSSTGQVCGDAIPAAHTVTFGSLKTGLLVGKGGQYSGQLHTVSIGLEEYLSPPVGWTQMPAEEAAGTRLTEPALRTDLHKYSRGVLHVVAGSPQYPGAAQLSVGAAVSTGVGMVRLEAGSEVASPVLSAFPEVVRHLDSSADEGQSLNSNGGTSSGGGMSWSRGLSAAAVGPGIGEDAAQREAVQKVLSWAGSWHPVVVDASALEVLTSDQLAGGLGENILLTPHAGEFRRLAQRAGRDDIAEKLADDPLTAAQQMAAHTCATVLLKGATTIIAAPAALGCRDGGESGNEGGVLIHRSQAPGLATAGSGDVLTGILGALCATVPDKPLWHIAGLGTQLHTRAAQRLDPEGRGHFGASHLIPSLSGCASHR